MRTLNDGEARYTNRLAQTTSPYLLQHAHNPVDWRPWGEEAFRAARDEDKPIFLSIGYSTCHWCHVMEHESFENEALAEVLNRVCIPIKVDREERPDVDNIYMQALLLTRGNGGWPLSAFLDHELKPFHLATYMRPDHFKQVLESVEHHWRSGRDGMTSQAAAITQAIDESQASSSETLGEKELKAACELLVRSFDSQYGGFGQRPKFPTPHNYTFLLRHAYRTGDTGDESTRRIVEHSLDAIARGGIHDHVGGGFHRYSTDREWLLPHFEKMLYDQAQLATAYLEAYQLTGQQRFADTARSIFTYVLRDMRDSDGAFYSAEDADSEGEEGKFYVWTIDELREVLGNENAEELAGVFGCKDKGNFHDEATGQLIASNILHLPRSIEDAAYAGFRPMLDQLLEARSKRVRPSLDDKVLTSWNALMISALSQAARILDEPVYLKAAQGAASFVLEKMRRSDGRLLRSYREGEAAIEAFLDDYAFMANALLDLYQADFDPTHIKNAIELVDQMRKLFHDTEHGGFFFSAQGQGDLIVRQKLFYDGAIAAGNSIAAQVMLKLAALSGREDLLKAVDGVFRACRSEMQGYSAAGFTAMMSALDLSVHGSREIVLAVPEGADVEPWLAECRAHYMPDTFVLLRNDGNAKQLGEILSFTAEQEPLDGKITAYICSGRSCSAPLVSLEAFREQLEKKTSAG